MCFFVPYIHILVEGKCSYPRLWDRGIKGTRAGFIFKHSNCMTESERALQDSRHNMRSREYCWHVPLLSVVWIRLFPKDLPCREQWAMITWTKTDVWHNMPPSQTSPQFSWLYRHVWGNDADSFHCLGTRREMTQTHFIVSGRRKMCFTGWSRCKRGLAPHVYLSTHLISLIR